MPGDFYEIVYSTDSKQWINFWYYPSGEDFFSLKKSSEGAIISEKKKLNTTVTDYNINGTIDSSLWDAMSSQGVPADIIMSFADDIFAWQMDFLTDTRKGDTSE